MREHLETLQEMTGGLCLFKAGDQISQRAVVNAASALRGGDGEADRQMRLPDTRRAEEDHVLPALNEAELVQALWRWYIAYSDRA